MRVTIEYGSQAAEVTVPDDRAVALSRRRTSDDTADAAAALTLALEHPADFPPLRQALTPEDRIALVIDGRLPQLNRLVAAVLDYLGLCRIDPAAVTVVESGDRPSAELDLPAEVQRTVHDGRDRQHLAYVAADDAGEPVHFNRAVAEADQTVVLSAVRANAAGPAHLYPAFAGASAVKSALTADEMAWLLGTPFFVQVIEGAGDTVAEIVAGIAPSAAAATTAFRRRWAGTVPRPSSLVIAGVSGDPRRITFDDLTIALTRAASLAETGGVVALLTTASPAIDDRRKWAKITRRVRTFLLSGLDDDVVEDARATPFHQAGQVQRLIDAADSCLILPDAHRNAARLEAKR